MELCGYVVLCNGQRDTINPPNQGRFMIRSNALRAVNSRIDQFPDKCWELWEIDDAGRYNTILAYNPTGVYDAED